MTPFRIALANLRVPANRDESVALAVRAIADASAAGARLVAFPECFVPGYRVRFPGHEVSLPPPDPGFLERAWSSLAAACERARISAAVGTERVVDGAPRIAVLVLDADGTIAGFQDKVQLDPSEESTFAPGSDRRTFRAGPVTFGIAICHEGFRYPETVRWAARHGAQLVVHPHFAVAEPGGYRPATFTDPRNTFHEKAMLCRAAENTCWVATVNTASEGSPTTSAVVRPDGTLLAYQPYGEHGLLVTDIELELATRSLASRWKADE